ncbi:hypothetical protein B2J93_7803 [Marssonina coronariae]|uniref:DUF221 domain-containing protein n=1 Tax=Diplocarpon coronariae TaxID=2795749 RepID=A0A218Z2P1_9HELO|nr:hypothetical protein B2J93_7803 [Marssonina coronariae]
MTDAALAGLVAQLLPRLDDPRVGSARDGANATSVKTITKGTNSASLATFFATLVPIVLYAVVCLALFIVGRRFCPRVYYPRTFLSSLAPHERSKPLPTGWVNWIVPFWKTPDVEILNHASLDGYLFLRYIRVLLVVCVVGACLTWPVLFPIHLCGGGGTKELDALTFGNLTHPSWMWAHAFLAWAYFGFILYIVARESVYFINIRQAYLLSPHYADRLSSRTVMFTCVPAPFLDEKKLRRIFGDAVRHVWIPRDTDELDELVRERNLTANRLERAEIKLIRDATLACRKSAQERNPEIECKPITASPKGWVVSHGTHQDVGKEVDATATSYSASRASDDFSNLTSPRNSDVFSGTDHNPRETQIFIASNIGSRARHTTSSPGSATTDMISPILASSDVTLAARSLAYSGPPPDINGSIAAQWIPASERPYHRPIANYGRRVDTIKWTRTRMKKLTTQINKLRRDYRKGKSRPLPAAFIEFHSQAEAQIAYQTLTHHRANHMQAEIVGISPHEIVWDSIYFRWWEKIARRFLVQGFVVAMVIFWALPSAAVALIAQISFLTEKLTFLSFINNLPSVILGLVSGLLPAVALSMLMSMVPVVMRACARQAGIATFSRIELFVQNSYFFFQVIQVFLVTTLVSTASTAITGIIKDPMSTPTLLSANLPKASNFYISYFILQGLAMSASRIVHLGGIIRHQLMRYSGGNPRMIARRYHRLRTIHWGSVFPVFTNMGVIAITYSLIAPIVLGVAAIGLGLVYVTYRYNLLYIYGSTQDSRGIFYPRALKQTLTGVYLAELCLVGLLALNKAFGPLVITFGLVIFTSLIHVSLNDALSPLLFNLPRTLAVEEELRKAGLSGWMAANLDDGSEAQLEENTTGYDSDFDPSATEPSGPSHGVQGARGFGPEGTDRLVNLTTTTISSLIAQKISRTGLPALITRLDFWSPWITPDVNIRNPNFVLKFLHPEIFADYHILRDGIPAAVRDAAVGYSESVLRDAYSPPSMRERSPRLWIPRDGLGVSAQEVVHTGKVAEITDKEAWIDDIGRVRVELEGEVEAWCLREWERVRF